jgi:predicted RecA/RadA family phage recombinase
MAKVYIEKERVDHIFVKNTTGGALEQGEFVILGGYSGVVDRSAAAGETASLHIEGNLEIQAAAEDLAAETNDYAENCVLYYNPAAKKFADAASTGYVKVGQIARNHLSGTTGSSPFSSTRWRVKPPSCRETAWAFLITTVVRRKEYL